MDMEQAIVTLSAEFPALSFCEKYGKLCALEGSNIAFTCTKGDISKMVRNARENAEMMFSDKSHKSNNVLA